ncbi:unnamed protein product, partial [Tenebrio molitor]
RASELFGNSAWLFCLLPLHLTTYRASILPNVSRAFSGCHSGYSVENWNIKSMFPPKYYEKTMENSVKKTGKWFCNSPMEIVSNTDGLALNTLENSEPPAPVHNVSGEGISED